jgi:hypothetical protein
MIADYINVRLFWFVASLEFCIWVCFSIKDISQKKYIKSLIVVYVKEEKLFFLSSDAARSKFRSEIFPII